MHSCLPFMAKFLIWRVMVGGLPVGDALRKRNDAFRLCFFCMVSLEHCIHCLITWLVSQSIWTWICVVWVSIAGCEKLLFNGVFQISFSDSVSFLEVLGLMACFAYA